jgi:hypothetical protein
MADITVLACELIRVNHWEDDPIFKWWLDKEKEKEEQK